MRFSSYVQSRVKLELEETKIKSHLHANASVHKFGGSPSDYYEIHEFLDSTKAHHADMRHRALLHNSWGIFLAERIFGRLIVNSSGKEVSVRDVAENHILEDLGRIPSVSDYLNNMTFQTWMGGKKTRRKKLVLNVKYQNPRRKPITEPVHIDPPIRELGDYDDLLFKDTKEIYLD